MVRCLAKGFQHTNLKWGSGRPSSKPDGAGAGAPDGAGEGAGAGAHLGVDGRGGEIYSIGLSKYSYESSLEENANLRSLSGDTG